MGEGERHDVGASVTSGVEAHIGHALGCNYCDREGPGEGDVDVLEAVPQVEDYVGCCVVDGDGPVMCVCGWSKRRVTWFNVCWQIIGRG